MKAGMTQVPRIQGSAGLETAARFMLFCDADRVEVVDEGGSSKGIVTERDVIRAIAKGATIESPVQELLTEPWEGAPAFVGAVPAGVPPVREARARDVMSTPAVACTVGTTLEEVAELLADREISGLPVINESEVVIGVISERDVARALGSPLIRLAIGQPIHSGSFLRQPRADKRAGEIMSTPPIVGHPTTPVQELASDMIAKRINRIPIVEKGRLVGIVTRGDILASVASTPQHSVEASAEPAVVGPRS